MVRGPERDLALSQRGPEPRLAGARARRWREERASGFGRRPVEIGTRQEEVLRACLGRDVGSAGPAAQHLVERLGAGDVDHDERGARDLGEGDGAMRGLALESFGMRDRMVAEGGAPGRHQAVPRAADRGVVLGVNHHANSFGPGRIQNAEHEVVRDRETRVSHEELDRGDATPRQFRDLGFDVAAGVLGENAVKAVVDDRLAVGSGQCAAERRQRVHARTRHGEGHDAGGAAVGRRDRAGGEIVGRVGAAPARLVEMAMGIDAARHHPASSGLDRLGAREATVERRDAAAVDAHVAIRPARVECHAAAADHEVMHGATSSNPGSPYAAAVTMISTR